MRDAAGAVSFPTLKRDRVVCLAVRVAVMLLITTLAGCLAAEDSPRDAPAGPEAPAAFDAGEHLADAGTPILPDAERALSDLETFVDLAPRRYDNMFEHDAARDWLQAELEAAGLNVTRHTFTGPAQAGTGQVEGQNILATLPGARSDRILMFGAHYDSATTGYGGAYDDGSGTILTVELARAMAAYEWEHTLVFALWDQEEAGLVGSTAYAEGLRDRNVSLTLFVNFDMTGINWPAKMGGVQDQPLDAEFGGAGEDDFAALWDVARAHMGYPSEATTTSTGLGTGSSDHGPFRAADLPAAWVHGALIGGYPGYHNADTVETMTVDVGGDRADLVAGFDTVLQMVFHFALAVDGAVAHGSP